MKIGIYILIIMSFFSCRKDHYTNENTPKISVYPNPFTSNFFIKSDGIKAYDMTMYDKTGQVIITKNKMPSGIISFSFDSLSNGKYFIKIESENISLFQPIIKQ